MYLAKAAHREKSMIRSEISRLSRIPGIVAAGLVALLAITPAPAVAAGKTYVMKLGLATVNDSQHLWCKLFAAAVEKDSHGAIKGEIFPASQLGSIPREIEGVQFGSIQGYIGPPEFLAGVDPRFEIPSTPGLVDGMQQAVRMTNDAAFKHLMLSVGGDKGIRSTALFIAQPSAVIARDPIRTLADFKGKKLRVLAAAMQEDMLHRLGATPVAMTLADVLPAIQQGTIDGAVAAITVFTTMQYQDAAKYVTETGQPFIFSMAFLSKRWYDALPRRLQTIITKDAQVATDKVNPWEVKFWSGQRQVWTERGGKLIELSPAEHATMMKILASIGEEETKSNPALHKAYEIALAASKRTR